MLKYGEVTTPVEKKTNNAVPALQNCLLAQATFSAHELIGLAGFFQRLDRVASFSTSVSQVFDASRV